MEDEANSKKVAKYIIKNTPIGHLGKSLENLKTIVGDKILTSSEVKQEIQNYNVTHLTPVQVDLINSKVVISNLNKDADDYYYDQGQGVRFKIKIDGGASIVNAEEIKGHEDTRDEVEKKLKIYLEKYYKKEHMKYNVYFDGVPNKINVIISAHNLNLRNFWSGEWLSTWELDLNSKKIFGNVRANTYYYEEGNVQFNLNTDFEDTASGENDEEIAENLVNFIEKSENKLQIDLDKVYENFSDVYIKPLRRNLPYTGTKMNWNLNQVQLNQ